MSKAQYQYTQFEVFNSFLIGFFGSYTTFSMLNNIKRSDKITDSILWLIFSSLSLTIFCIWPLHFLAIASMKFDDFYLFYKIDWTLISIILGFILIVFGFFTSFLPVLINIKRNFYLENANKEMTFFEYSQEKIKLEKKTLISLILGSFFIGSGILIIHLLGMFCVVFKGNMYFHWNYQILICLFCVFSGFLLTVCFYLCNSIGKLIFFSFSNSLFISIVHFSSVFATDFFYIETKDLDLNNHNIFKLQSIEKVIVVTTYCGICIGSEISNYWFRRNVGFLQYTEKILFTKKKSVGYLERIINMIRKGNGKFDKLNKKILDIKNSEEHLFHKKKRSMKLTENSEHLRIDETMKSLKDQSKI